MSAPDIPCRVCGESASFLFRKRVLSRVEAAYFRCGACGQVQTEEPYWLDEAYQNLNYQRDTGIVDRCLWTALTTVALGYRLKIGGDETCLDWGGGTGLFARICRDFGMNFFYQDRYADNVFARGFEFADAPTSSGITLLTAFEVLEHFPDPARDILELFRLDPQYILLSTMLYAGEGADWWYFSEDGQHVAFYTRRSLEVIAKRHGYYFLSDDSHLHMFSKRPLNNRILGACRKSRERLSARYRNRYGSRIVSDFEHIRETLCEGNGERSD